MTRTEERLVDALGAVGRSVREETLPRLPARNPAPGPGRWGRWLAPLAAAASVVLIVVVVSAIHLFSARPPGGGARIVGPPRYYVSQGESIGVQVRNTVTGAVTGRIRGPFSSHGSSPMSAAGVAAGDGGRIFVAAYTGSPPGISVVQTRLYTFHLTSAGRVTGLTLIKGGPLEHFVADGGLALSPDGSKVALTVYRPVSPASPPSVSQIVVINLRTGARSFWTGGLRRAGFSQSVPSISWRPGGDSLVFLSQWCRTWIVGGICGTRQHFTQVRTLRLTSGGGRLSAGSVLLSQSARYPFIVQALLRPDGTALTVVVLRGPPYLGRAHSVPQDLRVIQVPLGGAGPARLLYRGVMGPHAAVFLSSDASGRYLLLAWGQNGWIDHGRLRPLPPQGGVAFTDTW